MTEPPKFDRDAKLDFSRFHPLDHYPWQYMCKDYYGGWRIHMQYWWDLMAKDLLRKWFLCPLWIHHYQEWWRPNPLGRDHPMVSAGFMCSGCGKQKD